MTSGVEASIIKAKGAERRGDFTEAERLYGTVLTKFPGNARARKGLDQLFKNRALAQQDAPPQAAIDRLTAAYEQNRLGEAAAQAEDLLTAYPRSVFCHNLLGAALLRSGRAAEAERALRRAHMAGFRLAPICNNLGMAIAEQGRQGEALEFYREAIAADPGHAIARNNLGNALKHCGQPLEALEAYAEAVALQPDYADAFNNMGLVLEALDRVADALTAYSAALKINPDHTAAHNNVGNVLTGRGDLSGAIASYERALAIEPAYADALFNLGNVFKRQGRMADADLAYRRAKQARPNYADASAEQGKALAMLGRLDEAIAAFDDALKVDPDHTGALTHRLYYQAHACDWSAFDSWAQLDPSADAGCSPFAALTFEDDPARQLRRSRAWSQKCFPQASAPLRARAPASDGRIRIGYFSADFHDHATLYLMAGLLREHDRSRFAVHAFSYGPRLDSTLQETMLAHVDRFHEIGSLSDAAVDALAHQHEIDIAVDLKGYTQNGRLALFAQRLAPVQIAYLGYPGSSGAPFIDYMIADETVIPAAERAHYSEKLILLPGSYQPNDDARAIDSTPTSRAAFGLPEDAFVFCCFNQSYKITPREFAAWMRIMARVEDSVLWLLRSNEWAEINLRRAAAALGIAPERLIFADQAPHASHLARHAHADLFLDCFAVNAHTTASDALWAGLPVLTLAGRQFAARVATSLLGAVGLPELVTETIQDYEALAIDLANDPARLERLRGRLADRATQPLFDTKGYARKIEAGFTAAHRRCVEGLAPEDITVP